MNHPAKFCSACGKKIDPDNRFCSVCGASQGSKPGSTLSQEPVSPKSGLAAFILCLFLGTLGVHRFYVGKIGTGILMLITGGGFGLWYLYDLISIVCKNFTDSEGRVVEVAKNPSGAKQVLIIVGSIFAGFIVLISIFIIFILMLVSGLSGVAQDQLAAIRAGDYAKAYTYTSVEFQKSVSQNDFKNYINSYPVLKNNVSASFSRKEIQNNNGTLIGTITSKDGAVIPIEIHLIKENDIWKILSIHLTFPNSGIKSDTSGIHPSKPLQQAKLANVNLTNVLENKPSQYSIKYPWRE